LLGTFLGKKEGTVVVRTMNSNYQYLKEVSEDTPYLRKFGGGGAGTDSLQGNREHAAYPIGG
jgi:hypothetical protein